MARTQLRDSLPQVIASGADTGPLASLLAAADGMHQPVGDVLDHLESWFHTVSAPDPMVCYLASWVDLDWLTLPETPNRARSTLPGGTAPLRDLLAESADLAARRGTVGGIVRFLEVATGHTGFTVQDAGGFHLRVTVPGDAADLLETVARIVAATKPAHVTADVRLADAPAPVAAPGAAPASGSSHAPDALHAPTEPAPPSPAGAEDEGHP